MTDLDDRLREHYRSQQPSDALFSDLIDAEASPSTLQRIGHGLREAFRLNVPQVAMAVCVLGLVSVLVHNVSVRSEQTERARKEVALNHSTRMDLEFKNVSVAQLDEQMNLLPFDLSLPASITENYDIAGARYCSLSGQLAAHVKLIDRSTHRVVSVFLTKAAEELDAIKDSEKMINGVDVRIWRNDGIMYASAGPQQSFKKQ